MLNRLAIRDPNLTSLLALACEFAREAGQKIMPFYGGTGAITLKADASPLTAADMASHEFLVEALEKLTPGIPVVSEESKDKEGAQQQANRFWLVDPLDGTKEFMKGTGEFTVNIALIEGGKSVLGVVHAPVVGLTYYGLQSGGAWRQGAGQPAVAISTRKAERARLAVVASKDHAGPLVQAMLGRLPGATLKSMGSSLKFCLVADGSADLYLRDIPTMEWDTAAAQCVVEAAGGAIYDLAGMPLRYGKPELRNPSLMTVGDRDFDWQPLLQAAG